MALQCQIVMSTGACVAGQSPSPMATLQVYNPNASSVAVTGIQIRYYDKLGAPAMSAPVGQSMPALGPGQTVVVPTLSSVNFGPFPIAIASPSQACSYPPQPSSALNPTNPNSAMPPQTFFFIGADVMGSDGSVNQAGQDGLLVSYTIAPPVGYQGGFAHFSGPNNACLLSVVA